MNGYLINELWLSVMDYVPESERINVSRDILRSCVEHSVTDFEEDMSLLEDAQIPYGSDIEVFFEDDLLLDGYTEKSWEDNEWNE